MRGVARGRADGSDGAAVSEGDATRTEAKSGKGDAEACLNCDRSTSLGPPLGLSCFSAGSCDLGLANLFRGMGGVNSVVEKEKLAWAKDHDLNTDHDEREKLLPLLDNFPIGSEIQLCWQLKQAGGGFIEYEHFFISNKKWILEFGSGDPMNNTVTVHGNSRKNYCTKENKVLVDKGVRDRMAHVLGMTNYSLLLRNCEHVVNYVAYGRWTSMQTVGQGHISSALIDYMTDQSHRSIRNTLPKQLQVNDRGIAQPPLYPGVSPIVAYSRSEQSIQIGDDSAYNVLVMGPTGAGKSSIINLFFNKKICESEDSVDSVTRNIEFHVGRGECVVNGVRGVHDINLIDSIGFCDSELSSKDVVALLKQQVLGNVGRIHKVLVVTSGRIRKEEEESIKQMLKWLGYDPWWDKETNFSFIFVYTKTDGQSDEQKQRNLLKMCERLDIRTTALVNTATNEQEMKFMAVAFPPTAPFREIENDYKWLQKVIFTTDAVTQPIPVQRSMCAIM
ncbi:hypothetical protein EMIHUDRAFT_208032 [Emiliania huxleyi CCMP1516]|uniref:AIG1-type G domain-containing protein n=2 Tax=Emiliania huxleyi TaxID=2903 RepID=A0A0D3JBT9_EMIH1|nr:hypothetical protein EMIHUDRAFT_208032 [Emiliania huxleyi CCMP1516]EOD20974.1 hypothetical protein EMIHUDRAFT_208032 [Emiliania huxleyi CCMP1516]|eukprot:XP_005773403.1 hypothetical protein EMIHUDRAFT_208032 [Emiliania huxleyi CCMP1516]